METTNQNKQFIDVYQLVTNQVIALLEKGIIPWKQNWREAGLPQNLITGKPYRGINIWMLSSLQYPLNYFLSFQQAKDIGATVRKGEKSSVVVFWKWLEENDPTTGEKVKKPLLRYYRVFNIDQCSGIPEVSIPEMPQAPNDPIAECERILEKMPHCPPIKFGKGGPFYDVINDFVNMPKMKEFIDSESYYETLFHEIVHSTGSQKRLNRKEITERIAFGSVAYAKEELTAEFGAAFLKSIAGLKDKPLDNNVAYIQNWLKKLKDDKRFVVNASALAQHAVDYILNVVPTPNTETIMEATS